MRLLITFSPSSRPNYVAVGKLLKSHLTLLNLSLQLRLVTAFRGLRRERALLMPPTRVGMLAATNRPRAGT